MPMNRRSFIKLMGAATGAGLVSAPFVARAAEIMPKTGRRVVVVGGGFGGAIAAKYIRMADPSIEVVLIDREKTYVACPLSNLVLAGIRNLDDNKYTLAGLAANHGVKLHYGDVTGVDAGAKKVVMADGGTIAYDKLVLSPGVDYRYEEIEGYDPVKTPELMPHAWKAGPQTLQLRKQLEAMKDGGTVVLTVPTFPFRCPPGPYERTNMIAFYLKNHKPKSKIVVWDANANIMAKEKLFKAGWAKHYGWDEKDPSKGLIAYYPNSKLTKVDMKGMAVDNGVELLKGDVIAPVPAQKAGHIAHVAGVVEGFWCPVNQTTFESTKVKDIHIIGDAVSAAPLPKSAYSANSEAKVCALNIVQAMNDKELVAPTHVNVCYSYVTDNEAMSVAGVYREKEGKTVVSNLAVSPEATETEAIYGKSWMLNIMAETST